MGISTALAALLIFSRAWDVDAQLPYFPETNNSHLYFAYTLRLTTPSGGDITSLRGAYDSVMKATDGGMKRWKSDIGMSHDEVLGVAMGAYFMRAVEVNDALFQELSLTGGILPTEHTRDIRGNVYRMLDIEPVVTAAAGRTPSPLVQLGFALKLLTRAIFYSRGEYSDVLRTWVTFPLMQKFPICQAAIELWGGIMWIRGVTLPDALIGYFPTVPELSQYAKDHRLTFLSVKKPE